METGLPSYSEAVKLNVDDLPSYSNPAYLPNSGPNEGPQNQATAQHVYVIQPTSQNRQCVHVQVPQNIYCVSCRREY